MRKMAVVIFSDLGRAASFMALNWVQEGMREKLGFVPYPATLNVRPKATEDVRLWEDVRSRLPGVSLTPAGRHYCAARLYAISLAGTSKRCSGSVKGAIIVPDVPDYPKDKIEVVAPVRLKDEFGWRDGDQISLEFLH